MIISLIIDILAICLALALTFITYYKWNFQYWRKKKLPYLEPSIPFGNLGNTFKKTKSIAVRVQNIYDKIKSNKWKHGGGFFFARPIYVPVDLDYIKNILTKEFHHFSDRGVYVNEKDDPIGAHLFAIGGQKWRNLRTKLTPTFTSGKMKMMFQTLVDCEDNLQKRIATFYKKRKPIDIKEILGCFTTDIIGSCAFGLECNTFESDNSPFRVFGTRVFKRTTSERVYSLISNSSPSLARLLHIRQMPKEVSDFFFGVVRDTVNYREKNNYRRNDFMQILIDLKNDEGDKHDGKTLTMDEITAQSFVFFLAGFETSSTTMTFALYQLAKNQDIQEKVRNEINAVLAKHDGKITYESIQEMKYMNQVIDETLRLYPPVPFITRECVKDYKVPDEDVVIEKGTRVVVSIYGIHHDEEYYPEPEKFDPDRFNEENAQLRHQYAHIPFGEGPRVCIGLRFGLMQSKVGLTSLLRNYKFTVNEKTQEPLKLSPSSFVLTAEGDVWLTAHKL